MLTLPFVHDEPNGGSDFELVEGPSRDGVTVEVDFQAVGGAQKTEVLVGMEADDLAVWRNLVGFGAPARTVHPIQQLASGGGKRITNGRVDVLVGPGVVMFVVDADRVAPLERKLEPDRIQAALMMALVREIDGGVASHQPVGAGLESFDLLVDPPLYGLRGLHAVKRDLDGDLHASILPINRLVVGGKDCGAVRVIWKIQPGTPAKLAYVERDGSDYLEAVNFEKYAAAGNAFLNEVADELGRADKDSAGRILRAVLHALRSRLTIAQSFHLMAQLPMILRAVYVDGWKISEGPDKSIRSVEDLVEAVGDQPGLHPLEDFPNPAKTRQAIWAVFRVLKRHISQGESKDVQGELPAALAQMWNEA